MLDINELCLLQDKLFPKLADHAFLTELITLLNRRDQLSDFLSLIGLDYLLDKPSDFLRFKKGRILVLGDYKARKNDLMMTATKFGLGKDQVEYCLCYDELKHYNFNKLQYNSTYSAVLVGPIPHSVNDSTTYSSIVSRMEKEEGFPPVVRIGGISLSITKTSFKKALEECKEKKYIEV